MASIWIHRLHIIIDAADRDAANQLAASIDPDSGGALTFGPPTLSATGEAPATHSITNTAATEAMRQAMLGALAQSGLPVMFWRLDAATGTLQDSNVSKVTSQPWTIADTLSTAGLQFVESDIE